MDLMLHFQIQAEVTAKHRFTLFVQAQVDCGQLWFTDPPIGAHYNNISFTKLNKQPPFVLLGYESYY